MQESPLDRPVFNSSLCCRAPHPKLNSFDRLFWTTLRRVWPRWADVLVIVGAET
jgi:hypothetical protein